METNQPERGMTHGQLLELKRWNTPTIYNGWEQITQRDRTRDGFNLEETRDFMPQMGVMVGYAVTLVVHPSNASHRQAAPTAWSDYRRYVASQPGPKIVVVQDLDKPQTIGSFWGEVNANTHRALGCVGTITDGAIRDVSDMTNAGFKALARRTCVGHAWSWPVKWGCDVEVFGQRISPGQLIHADMHGFMAMTPEEESKILEAARFMDSNECSTVIRAARDSSGKTTEELLKQIDAASAAFRAAARERFAKPAEF
ncbi:MAG TPA: RraA family protein [Tepidisphaeraceae bacterium]|jgi:regulator of RNase E activity RraA